MCPHGQGGGGVSHCGHFADMRGGGSIFCNFVRTSFMNSPLAISEVAKNLLLEKMHNQNIAVLFDSQAAIKAVIKCTVASTTVFNCIRNLNQLRKQNHFSIAWIPEHAGVHGNEVEDNVAKSRSKSKIHGLEPFITVQYASCVSTIKDRSTNRCKSM